MATIVTLIVVAPLMTWLFVRTSPDDVTTTPVPAAAPLPKPSTVSMSTTPGSTFAAIAAGSDEAPLTSLGTVAVLVEGVPVGTLLGLVAGVDVDGADAAVVAFDWLSARLPTP